MMMMMMMLLLLLLLLLLFSDKKDMAALTKLCQASAALNKLNLSGCAIPAEPLRDLILTISKNVYLQNVELQLSSNGFGLEGAKSIISVISDAVNIEILDVSDNELGDEVSHEKHISKNECLKKKRKTHTHREREKD
jgi:Ran GTPase-activating protein (RanGAP) involved in mRNA processing and transport